MKHYCKLVIANLLVGSTLVLAIPALVLMSFMSWLNWREFDKFEDELFGDL